MSKIAWGHIPYHLQLKRRRKKRKLQQKLNQAKKAREIKNIVNKAQYNKLKKFANKIQEKQYKSEVWFEKLYETYKIPTDKFNVPFFRTFIPDVVNGKYRYIVEVDGSIHLETFQIKKDKRKDKFYSQKGFEVIRIIAFNKVSFQDGIKQLLKIRQDYWNKEKINKL